MGLLSDSKIEALLDTRSPAQLVHAVLNEDWILQPISLSPLCSADAFSRKTHVEGKRFCNLYYLYGSCSGDYGYLHEREILSTR
jgi:hypothetical protein